jgi:hypothetical protein
MALFSAVSQLWMGAPISSVYMLEGDELVDDSSDGFSSSDTHNTVICC